MDELDLLEDFQERVENVRNQLDPILADEEHTGVCVYALLNALGNELGLMITDCKQNRSELMEQLNKDLNSILDWELEINRSVTVKKTH
jgi:hypothetical protein